MRRLNLVIVTFLLGNLLWSQEGFGDIFGGSEEVISQKSGVEITGEKGIKYSTYIDEEWDSERSFTPYSNLEFLLATDLIEAKTSLRLEVNNLQDTMSLDSFVDEIFLRSFFPLGYADVGYFKTEWGKGDGVHVVDPLNPLDQTKGILSDINEMKQSQVMVKLNSYMGERGLLEVVYKPNFTPIKTAESGRWAVADMSILPNLQDSPDTDSYEYGEVAARLTGNLIGLDLGVIYYRGFMGEPGYKVSFTGTDFMDPTHYQTEEIYTKASLIGVELGGVFGPVTFRSEAGYWFTEDEDGSESHLYNNRVVWLGGVDFMVPGTSIFVSLQEYGKYIMDYEEDILGDVDLGMSNTIIGSIETPFYQDKMKLRLSGLYQFENKGYMVLPSFFWNIQDDLELSVTGQFFGGENEGFNPYYSWRKNDNISIELKYVF